MDDPPPPRHANGSTAFLCPIAADALESEFAVALAHVQLELPIFLPTGRRSGDRGRARTRRRSQGRVHGIWSSFGVLPETSRAPRRSLASIEARPGGASRFD